MSEERYIPFVMMPRAKPVMATVPPPEEPEPDLPPKTTKVVKDKKWLVPAFRERVDLVLQDLEDKGYEPLLWETLRTKERGRYLKKKGASKNGDRSMHIYGVAADIICKEHMWQCHKHGCDFFKELGKSVRKMKVYWGGDWKSLVDLPHLQGVPVKLQNKIRGSDDVAQVVEDHLSKRPV
jgi:hypothetical protein